MMENSISTARIALYIITKQRSKKNLLGSDFRSLVGFVGATLRFATFTAFAAPDFAADVGLGLGLGFVPPSFPRFVWSTKI